MPTDLTLAEISALADVPTRTIRYYLAQGLLPGPGREGPGTRYPVSVLHRLRLLRKLQRDHLPLAEIRKRLAGLSDDEVAALAEEPVVAPPADDALEYVRRVLGETSMPSSAGPPLAPPPTAPSSPTAPSPSSGELVRPAREPSARMAAPAHALASAPPVPTPPERSQWERIVLEPDVEIHVRRPLSRIANKRVERLVAFARELLEEDRP